MFSFEFLRIDFKATSILKKQSTTELLLQTLIKKY